MSPESTSTSSRTIIVAESGSDITPRQAFSLDINVLPMHVALGAEGLDDGAFPISRIYDHVARTGELPRTSASTPGQYQELFQGLRRAFPNSPILHLCYSAATTATYQNALIGAEGVDGITHVDTKGVCAGQGLIVMAVARMRNDHPEMGVEKLADYARDLAERTDFRFIPGDLSYLKAGGRVSNAAYLGATLLRLRPLIEVIDGRLTATGKYRGSMLRSARHMVEDFFSAHDYEDGQVAFVWSEGLGDDVREMAEGLAAENGHANPLWVRCGGVITSHAGPGALGVCGIARS
jgi:DegV family protein with EDD domain